MKSGELGRSAIRHEQRSFPEGADTEKMGAGSGQPVGRRNSCCDALRGRRAMPFVRAGGARVSVPGVYLLRRGSERMGQAWGDNANAAALAARAPRPDPGARGDFGRR